MRLLQERHGHGETPFWSKCPRHQSLEIAIDKFRRITDNRTECLILVHETTINRTVGPMFELQHPLAVNEITDLAAAKINKVMNTKHM